MFLTRVGTAVYVGSVVITTGSERVGVSRWKRVAGLGEGTREEEEGIQ